MKNHKKSSLSSTKANALQELAPCYPFDSWLPGFIGPVPPPLKIRAENIKGDLVT